MTGEQKGVKALTPFSMPLKNDDMKGKKGCIILVVEVVPYRHHLTKNWINNPKNEYKSQNKKRR